MKILYLIKSLGIGGAEKFTFELSDYFFSRGHEITIFSGGGQLENKINKEIKTVVSSVLSGKEKINLWKLRSELSCLVSENNFDIIHTQHRILQFAIQTLIKRNFKTIYTAHNYFKDFYQNLLRPDLAVAISNTIHNNLVSCLKINKSKIRKINIGTKIPDGISLNNNYSKIGFAGRLVKEKGIIELIKSMEVIIKFNSEINLLIYGEGELFDWVFNYIKEKNLSNNIQLFKNDYGLENFFSNINMLILPTVMNEGLPLVILEALARKKLVLTTDKGGIKDVIKDNETGLILDNVSPQSISEAIISIQKNRELLSNLPLKGYNLVKTNHNLDLMFTEYEKLYEELTAE